MMRAFRNITLAVVFLFALTAVPAMATNPREYSWDWLSEFDGTQCWHVEGCVEDDYICVWGTERWKGGWFYDASGGHHYRNQVSVNVKALGDVTGQEYVYHSQYTEQMQGDFDSDDGHGFPWEHSQVFHWVWIAKGKAPDLRCQMLMHITIDANGEVPVEVDWMRGNCECTQR